MVICSVDGCRRQVLSRGWCNMHYKRWRTHGDPSAVTRFEKSFDFSFRDPSADEIRDLLDYNPETGEFTWRKRVERNSLIKSWNARFAGRRAGVVDRASGYVRISIGGRLFLAHRLAVIWMTGGIPAGMETDHRNRDASDNRWSNIRVATTSENQANKKAPTRNKYPGIPKGVLPNKNGRFRANIKVRGKNIHLGYFDTVAEAQCAYIAASTKYFRDFARAG
jgi:hypothetical protein